MKTLSIFAICVLLKVSQGKEPQVYEHVDDQLQVESNTRVVREPVNQQRPKVYKPPVFRYHDTAQQDQRRFRYAQQQRIDMQNILRKSKMVQPEAPLRVSLVQNWKAIDPSVSSSTVEQNYQLPEEEKVNATVLSRVAPSSTKKPVTSRKLKPSSYYEDFGEKIKRQDNNQIVYVDPELVKNRRSEYDLNALNALVGQNPSNQLEGLKRLLQSPQSNFILPPIKGPLAHPITEQNHDIPNPNTHPNIDTSVSIDSIQSQLDEAAKAQLAKALAEAQQQAQQQVEAQHRAIAKAQAEVQKKVLAQIALHNQGLKPIQPVTQQVTQPLKQPVALPLKQPVALPLKQPVALPLKQEVVPVNLYAPNHSHQHQKIQEPKLKKISITKTHPVTQGRQSPNTYQEVVLETQHNQKVLPGVNQLKFADNVDEHQYAARYAFGYKIRDVKMGNEFGHEEKRDGENAKGLYHVLLPDGRMQKVEYYADPSGYHAKVTYENLAH
ncbi:uncharacterized protein LOC135127721 [Zophobas morio]|uniref:uncharacterized protein LOC135127721 n=1 Tax=Zophobas morio TaxID=2755281 RepID=UPI003083869E